MFDMNNINIRLLAINKVLFVVAVLLADPFHFFESTYESSPKLLKIKSKADIKEVKISGTENGTINLNKSDSGWAVSMEQQKQEYPAVGNRIDAALDTILDMRKFYEVTSNKDKHVEFQVNDTNLKLELTANNKTYTVYIGKQGASYNTSLVRIKDDSTVYSVKGNLRSDWNQNLDYFRVKKLFQISKENIQEVTATGAKNFHITSAPNNGWNLILGGITMPSNTVRINRLMDDISMLEGTEFYYGPLGGFFYGNIKIILKSNTEFNLKVQKSGSEYLVQTEQNPYWQKIPEYRINSIFPQLSELSAAGNK